MNRLRSTHGGGAGRVVAGIAAVAILVLGLFWLQPDEPTANGPEVAAVRRELATRRADAENYRLRFASLKWNAAKIRAAAEAETQEPLRSWMRERARLFDTLVAAIDRGAEEKVFGQLQEEIEELCVRGGGPAARALLRRLPAISFPAPEEFLRVQRATFHDPLARLSRQNPEFYRAFHAHEPEAAKIDLTALRAELSATNADAVTPQLMLNVELLTAVTPPDDPDAAEWSALSTAVDFFEDLDAATLARWRRARQAVRLQDWPTATEQMQAIVRSKVRTRQPFRAALGRAILRSQPDQPAAAYPFLVEAAVAGDRQARAWVAKEDFAQGRSAQALRWIEQAVEDGETENVPLLLALYAKEDVPRDRQRQIGLLEKISARPDAAADALLMLGRVYESGGGKSGSLAQAADCYQRAAAKGSAAASAEAARCALRGLGMAADVEQARDWACRAYNGGEHEKCVPILIELMQRMPERTAGAVQQMFEQEGVATPAGYQESRVVVPGVAQLRSLLGRYFDQKGMFGHAAQHYAWTAEPVAKQRHAELTAVRPCDTCGGGGKVQTSVPCPTCTGKGSVICSYCTGKGTIFVPGTPPCATCGGSGTVEQERKTRSCSACAGTGKGKGSMIKQDCATCVRGSVPCTACSAGKISMRKECPDCRGKGSWSHVQRSAD